MTSARLYRKARLTAVEASYVAKRVRRLLGLRGRPRRSGRQIVTFFTTSEKSFLTECLRARSNLKGKLEEAVE